MLLADRPGDWSAGEYQDEDAGLHRVAFFDGGELRMCLFAGPTEAGLPDPSFLKASFGRKDLSREARVALLAGREGGAPAGDTICVCFGIGLEAIRAAILAGARDAETLGAKLKAGTNCGSCQPELRRIIRQTAPQAEHLISN
jgi:assimilatory nitrate reductase catalytic subunit